VSEFESEVARHGAPLLVDPALSFADLERALLALGWRRDATRPFTPDLIPGEPELAGFSAPDGLGHLAYTFNPVVQLRVLAPRDVRHDQVAELERRLPLLRARDALALLRDADPRRALLGVLAAETLEEPLLLDAVQALAAHSEPALARAAQRAALRLGELARARDQALEVLGFIAEQARPLLTQLTGPLGAEYVRELAPRPEDYAAVFVDEVAARARAAYEELWREPPVLKRSESQTELEIHAAPAGMLRSDNELSQAFPQGYRAVAVWLRPERVWLCWRYRSAGQRSGMRFDGLVWVEGRWAWFPKPYRALGVAPG
jgi:hypothetical protein